MAQLWHRWRAPLLGGVALWLLSFPLLTSHPTPVTPVAAHDLKPAGADWNDHGLVLQQLHEQQLALAASQAVAALASPSPVIAATVTLRPVAPAPAAAPQPPPAPAVRANNIVIPRLGLNQPVGWYSDCLGHAAVPRWGTWRWSCAGANNIYVMAHNPGIFTPILGLHAGDIIRYGDPSGRVHTYRVSFTTIVSNTQMWPLGATSSSALTLQTCWTWDGSRDFIVRALEI
ncbi:MAG TPA: sortase [Candidatus Dormibacteraeota bacterium]|nr:sortase [Candidatus Dormibacteraeota bacterium]